MKETNENQTQLKSGTKNKFVRIIKFFSRRRREGEGERVKYARLFVDLFGSHRSVIENVYGRLSVH